MRVMVKDQAAVIQDAKGLRVFIHRQQERVREYIAEQLEKETQSDIKRAMTSGTNKVGDMEKNYKIGSRLVSTTKTILDVIMKFFVECLYVDKTTNENYVDETLHVMLSLLANNGKTFDKYGLNLHNQSKKCTKYPITEKQKGKNAIKMMTDYDTIEKAVNAAMEKSTLGATKQKFIDINDNSELWVSSACNIVTVCNQNISKN